MKSLLMIPLTLLAFAACEKSNTGGSAPSGAPSATAPSAGGSTEPLAKINGEPVTDAEVTERVKTSLRRLDSQIFDIKSEGLADLIEEKLLSKEAEKRKMSVDELVKVEVEDKVEAPSEQEIESFYNMAKQRFNNAPLAEVKNELVQQIKGSKKSSLYAKFVGKLKEDAKVEVLMQRPRIEVSVDDDPGQGEKGAAITLIEFSDFQCPFCKRTRPTIAQIMETYKGKVYYVFRDFPLSFHKQAQKASEAAQCAGEQDKYWPYNDMLWENQTSLQIEDLKGYAKKLGLNESKFNQCLDSGKFAQEVEKDANDGAAAGVSGTPAYFVNGIFISGAQPFEKFQSVIDSELMLKK
ncbi:MAG: thioredoxin domain-containing protein [Deltaproteobacteria bacterium]|nr:thioredoxin domain-containing protein [Deltaproteobacteria bacterium]